MPYSAPSPRRAKAGQNLASRAPNRTAQRVLTGPGEELIPLDPVVNFYRGVPAPASARIQLAMAGAAESGRLTSGSRLTVDTAGPECGGDLPPVTENAPRPALPDRATDAPAAAPCRDGLVAMESGRTGATMTALPGPPPSVRRSAFTGPGQDRGARARASSRARGRQPTGSRRWPGRPDRPDRIRPQTARILARCPRSWSPVHPGPCGGTRTRARRQGCARGGRSGIRLPPPADASRSAVPPGAAHSRLPPPSPVPAGSATLPAEPSAPGPPVSDGSPVPGHSVAGCSCRLIVSTRGSS